MWVGWRIGDGKVWREVYGGNWRFELDRLVLEVKLGIKF
jgi:hypothetical protein